MTQDIEVKGTFTRRNFMKGALAAAAAMGVGAAAPGCAPAGGTEKNAAATDTAKTSTRTA